MILCSDPSLGWLVTVLAVSSKTLSNVAWFINYVQTMELFPTKARVSGMNICATASTLAGMAAPYLVYLVRCISVAESTFSTVLRNCDLASFSTSFTQVYFSHYSDIFEC